MSEGNRPVISPENMPVVSSVAFILALLGVVLAGVGVVRTTSLAASLLVVHGSVVKHQQADKEHEAKISALEARIAALEGSGGAAAATTATTSTTDAVPAETTAK